MTRRRKSGGTIMLLCSEERRSHGDQRRPRVGCLHPLKGPGASGGKAVIHYKGTAPTVNRKGGVFSDLPRGVHAGSSSPLPSPKVHGRSVSSKTAVAR